MAVKYRRLPAKVSRDRERVSGPVYELVMAVYQANWRGNVNEGHRTFARQQELYELYLGGQGNLAAVPSHNAPHIRTGRNDHAVDLNDADGFIARAQRLGVACFRPVAGESWHVEFNAAQLARFARKRQAQRARSRKSLVSARKAVKVTTARLRRAKKRLGTAKLRWEGLR